MAGGVRKSTRSKIRSSNEEDDDSVRKAKPPARVRKERGRDGNMIGMFGFNLKAFLGIGVVASVVIVVLVKSVTKKVESGDGGRLRVATPFPAPKLMDLPQFGGEHKESLYWGTYRPHVYFGIRARTPQSIVAGLMWIGIKDGRLFIRHVCQDGDGLHTYGWTHHNGRDYGRQTVIDQDLILKTSFLKTSGPGSGYGGDWAVQVDLQSKKPHWNEEMGGAAHLFFYVADEEGNTLSYGGDTINIKENSLLAKGLRKDVGNWQLHLGSQDTLDVHFSGFRTSHLHNLSDLVQESLAVQARKLKRLQLPDTLEKSSNILVFQISGRVPFTADLAFVSGSGTDQSNFDQRVDSLTGAHLSSKLREKQKEFDDKFNQSYDLNNKLDQDSIVVGKAAIANMLGGIGYFYGQSKISLPTNYGPDSAGNFIMYWPAELYTAIPSRSFFPRGFLWDEGFHQLLVWRWDIKISLDILGHWLDLMNIDGWIPREQILGAEALSKVPQEFVMQYPSNGNPPTLFLVIKDLIQGLKGNRFSASESKELTAFLDRAYVRLDAWFQWFNTTQSGKAKGSYYWHGRDNKTNRELNPKSLSSGLDDYPRASHPNEEERHLDLRCWMLLSSDCMHSIGMLHKNNEMGKEYGLTAKLLSDFEFLNEMHYDTEYGAYFDFGNHTEKVRLSWKETIDRNGYPSRELVREVLQQPKLGFVPHVGYVSLFPFMTKIIPSDSIILQRQLDLISNKSILWTEYGLRSLSRSSSIYMKRNTEHDPPYWRGPIWINMNYLVLSALRHYSIEDGPYKERAHAIYSDLRNNLIRNVVSQYHETGYLWEQYDQKKGLGKGARPFTGWTSLIVLIMAEIYS